MTGGAITTATDVYALGGLLYRILTGGHPSGKLPVTAAEKMQAVVDVEPVRPSDIVTLRGRGSGELRSAAASRGTTPERLRRRLRGDLDTIVLKTLKKKPGERYGSVTALAEDLRRFLAHAPISARPDSLLYSVSRFALPPGEVVKRNESGVEYLQQDIHFDFFAYSGISRPVVLVATPRTRIEEMKVVTEVVAGQATVKYALDISGDASVVRLRLIDETDSVVSESTGARGVLQVDQPHLWEVGAAYLYLWRPVSMIRREH